MRDDQHLICCVGGPMHITFFVWCRGGFPRNGFFSDDGFDPLQVRWANVTPR